MFLVADISIYNCMVYEVISYSAASDWLVVLSTMLSCPIGKNDCFDQRKRLNGWFWPQCCRTGRFRSGMFSRKGHRILWSTATTMLMKLVTDLG